MKPVHSSAALFASSILSGLAIIANLFGWMLGYGLLSAQMLLGLIVAAGFAVVLLWSLVHAIRGVVTRDRQAAYPLFINTVAIFVIWVAARYSWPERLDFWLNYPRRMQVVQRVKDGTLKPNVSHNDCLINLPSQYRSLTDGGEILVERRDHGQVILFYTYRGILHFGSSGFVYKDDGRPVTSKDIGCKLESSSPLDRNWSHTDFY